MTRRRRPGVLAIYLLLLAGILNASALATGETVRVSDAWIRATVPGQQVAGAYMAIRSSENAALVAVATPAANSAQIHLMRIEDGMMKMRRVDRLDLPAGKAVTLAPGGYHLMLSGLKQPLRPGDRVSLLLTVEGRNKVRTVVTVTAEVRGIGEADDPHPRH